MTKFDTKTNMFDDELYFLESDNIYCTQHYDKAIVVNSDNDIVCVINADCCQNVGYLKVRKV